MLLAVFYDTYFSEREIKVLLFFLFLLSGRVLYNEFTMRLSSFLFISVALHAAALTYPAVSFEPRGQEPIAVMVLNLGDGDGGGIKGDGQAEGKKGQPGGPKRRPPAPQARVTDSKEKA